MPDQSPHRPFIRQTLEYSFTREVLQRCIHALVDPFAPISIPRCSLNTHARYTTVVRLTNTNNEDCWSTIVGEVPLPQRRHLKVGDADLEALQTEVQVATNRVVEQLDL